MPRSASRQPASVPSAFRHAAVFACVLSLTGGLVHAEALRVRTVRVQNLLQAQSHAPHEPKKEERGQIEDLERQFRKAQLAGDVTTMDKLLSEDYLGINANGELSTKTQQLDHMRNRAMVITQLTPLDTKIKLIGPTAIVTSLVQVEGQMDGTQLRGQYRYTRVYQRMPDGEWKITSFEATHIRRP